MRHRRGNRKLNRPTDQRIAMLGSIVSSLFEYGKVKVTEARAREARRLAEKLITLCKKDNLFARRQVFSYLRKRELVKKAFAQFPERFEGRAGGYTRLTKAGFRCGDAAPLAILELT